METLTVRRQANGIARIDMEEYFDDAEVENLYHWIDRIPLSRPKRDMGKDFSDAVLVAEVINYYFPKMVNLHNYSPVNATRQKMENWYLLNRRVLKKFDLDLSDDVIRSLSNAKPKVIQKVLLLLRLQIDKMLERQGSPTRGYLFAPTSPHQSPRRSVKTELPHSHPFRATYHLQRQSPYPSVGAFLQPLMDNVPRELLEEKEAEAVGKEETIRIMHAKIQRLEHLLQLKETRIQDIESQIIKVQGSAVKYSEKRWN